MLNFNPETNLIGSEPKKKDWIEDFVHENGNYQNLCVRCNNRFLGHKRRRICKSCFQPPKEPTGILKDLLDMERVFNAHYVRWEDVEKIINKYLLNE